MVCRALSASEGCGLVVVYGVWFVVCVSLCGFGCPLGLVACVCGCSCFCVFVFVCLVLVVSFALFVALVCSSLWVCSSVSVLLCFLVWFLVF